MAIGNFKQNSVLDDQLLAQQVDECIRLPKVAARTRSANSTSSATAI
jgi:hypothetical protein